MRSSFKLAALVMLWMLCGAAPVRAEIQTRVVLVHGVKLSPPQAKAAHAKAIELGRRQIELFDDPSMTSGPSPPPAVTYAGRVLAARTADRTSQVAAAPLPSADQIAAVKRDLVAAGLPDGVALVALVVYSGGK